MPQYVFAVSYVHVAMDNAITMLHCFFNFVCSGLSSGGGNYFLTSTLPELGVMAHNHLLLVWDSDTSGMYNNNSIPLSQPLIRPSLVCYLIVFSSLILFQLTLT